MLLQFAETAADAVAASPRLFHPHSPLVVAMIEMMMIMMVAPEPVVADHFVDSSLALLSSQQPSSMR